MTKEQYNKIREEYAGDTSEFQAIENMRTDIDLKQSDLKEGKVIKVTCVEDIPPIGVEGDIFEVEGFVYSLSEGGGDFMVRAAGYPDAFYVGRKYFDLVQVQ